MTGPEARVAAMNALVERQQAAEQAQWAETLTTLVRATAPQTEDPRECDCGKGRYCPLVTQAWTDYLGAEGLARLDRDNGR